MKKGQLTLIGLIFGVIIFMVFVAFMPVFKSVTEVAGENDAIQSDSGLKYTTAFFPALIFIAVIAGFFIYNTVVKPI